MDNDFLGQRRKIRKGAVALCALFALCVLLAFRFSQVGMDPRQAFSIDKKWIEVFTNIVYGAFASVIASFVFQAMLVDSQDKLNRIGQLANKDFLESFFSDLTHFDGRYCEDYNVTVNVTHMATHPGLVRCTIRYDYKKILRDRHLRFKITRIRKIEDRHSQPDPVAAFFSHESYFQLDEIEVPVRLPDCNYQFSNLIINNQKNVTLKTIPNDEMFVEYHGELPSDIALNSLVQLSYEVSFPLEIESMLSVNFELPTKRARISFNFASVADLVVASSKSFISLRHEPVPIGDHDSTHVLDFAHAGWLLPKNGVVFSWWLKSGQWSPDI